MIVLVTVVILAEDDVIRDKLEYYDLKVQTIADVAPIQVYPAKVLSHLFSHLGMTSPFCRSMFRDEPFLRAM